MQTLQPDMNTITPNKEFYTKSVTLEFSLESLHTDLHLRSKTNIFSITKHGPFIIATVALAVNDSIHSWLTFTCDCGSFLSISVKKSKRCL